VRDEGGAAAGATGWVAGKAVSDGGEAGGDGAVGAATGTDGVDGRVAAGEGAGWLTTTEVASPTGLAWLATVFPAPLTRPPTGVAAIAGVVQATVPRSTVITAADVSVLKECSASPSIAEIRLALCRVIPVSDAKDSQIAFFPVVEPQFGFEAVAIAAQPNLHERERRAGKRSERPSVASALVNILIQARDVWIVDAS
jgi:hypothetical protein